MNLFPVLFAPAHRQDLTHEEQKKYRWVRNIIIEVGKRVGISDPASIDFRITRNFDQNACVIGSVLSWGGPIMCLGNDYFHQFESPKILSDPDYWEWKEWVTALPDHPLEMGRALSRCSPAQRQWLYYLAMKFQAVLTKEELQGIAAHELGHAKHLHSLKTLFFLFPMAGIAMAVARAVAPYFGIAAHVTAILLFKVGFSQVQQALEKEADEETSVSHIYSSGIKSFFKRHVIAELTENAFSSPVRNAEKLIRQVNLGSHPSAACRILAAIERKERPVRPISLWEKGIALGGGMLLIREMVPIIISIWNSLFREEKKTKRAATFL